MLITLYNYINVTKLQLFDSWYGRKPPSNFYFDHGHIYTPAYTDKNRHIHMHTSPLHTRTQKQNTRIHTPTYPHKYTNTEMYVTSSLNGRTTHCLLLSDCHTTIGDAETNQICKIKRIVTFNVVSCDNNYYLEIRLNI